MAQFRCESCYYVYDENKGDRWSGVIPGVKFEDLPENWVCPVCMAEKEMFTIYPEEEFLKDFFENVEREKMKPVH